jgi:predicted ATPase
VPDVNASVSAHSRAGVKSVTVRSVSWRHEQRLRDFCSAGARFWRDRGKVRQARELLGPVYGWFTEGFATLNLKEAKALLEQLS